MSFAASICVIHFLPSLVDFSFSGVFPIFVDDGCLTDVITTWTMCGESGTIHLTGQNDESIPMENHKRPIFLQNE